MDGEKVQLVITMNEAGKIEVAGPVQNKVLSYGLLELARDAIKDYHDKQAQQRVVPAGPADLLAMRRNHQ